MRAIVYTAPGCTPCHKVMDFLKNRGVEVMEVDAAEAGFMSVPVIQFVNSNGPFGPPLVGCDYKTLKDALYRVMVVDRQD